MAVLSNAAHAKAATIAPSKGYPAGRFPMPDLLHARLALQDLPKAKGLSSNEKAEIRADARAKLAGRKAAAKKAATP